MEEKTDYEVRRKSPLPALFWIFTVAAALVVLIVFAVPMLLDQGGVENTGGLTVSQVVDNPVQYAGQIVALTGEVDNTIGSRGFTLDGPGVVNDKMLVVSRAPLEAVGGGLQDGNLFTPNDEVLVSGTVRQFDIAELEKELGVDLNEDEYRQYEGQYIFIADTVTKVDE